MTARKSTDVLLLERGETVETRITGEFDDHEPHNAERASVTAPM